MPWQRDNEVKLGTVWRRFKGKERNGNPALSYQIRDLPLKDKDICLELMKKTFLEDEPLCKILDISSDPASMKTVVNDWSNFVDYHASLACYTEDDRGEPDQLVAFNICLVKCIDDEELYETEGENWKKLLATLTAAEKCCNVFEHYNVNKYMTSSGMTVLPAHRGQNIGAELIRAREPLCKALGIQAVATVFTAITSQVLATKCGYEVLGELKYTEMLQQGIDLSGADTKSAKLMGIKFK